MEFYDKVERQLIGTLLMTPRSYDTFAETPLKPEHFNDKFCGEVWGAICEIANQGKSYGMMEIKREMGLDGVGVVRLSELTDTYRASQYEKMPLEIIEGFIRRRIKQIAERLSKESEDLTGDPFEIHGRHSEELAEVMETLYKHRPVSVAEAAEGFYNSTMDKVEAFRKGEKQSGISTGLTKLDELLGGWKSKKLYTIAARPAMGKTTFAAIHAPMAARKENVKSGVISKEMPWEELLMKYCAYEGEIDSRKIDEGSMNDSELEVFRSVIDRLMKGAKSIIGKIKRLFTSAENAAKNAVQKVWGIFIEDKISNDVEVRAMVRQMVRKYGIGMLIDDYVQITTTKKRYDREDIFIGEVCRMAKEQAKALDIPYLLLCQLRREVEDRAVRVPIMRDLSKSAGIEQNSDVIITLYCPMNYGEDYFKHAHSDIFEAFCIAGKDFKLKNLCRIDVLKHRGGKIGMFWCYFVKETGRFTDIPESEYSLIESDVPAYEASPIF